MSENNQYCVIIYLEGFHPVKIGQKISDCEFGFEQRNKKYFLSTIVSAENDEKAKCKGELRLKQVLSLITLHTGVTYPIWGMHLDQISGEKPFIFKAYLTLKRKTYLPLDKEKIEEITESLNILDNLPTQERSTKITDKAINYFLRGCFLETKWLSESFLNFYKVIELISNEFRKTFDAEINNQLKDTLLTSITEKEIKQLRTPTRLIQFTCEQLGINPSCNISHILDIRNGFSAHARLKEVEVSDSDKNDCKILAAKSIIFYTKYIKKKQGCPE